MLYLLIYFTLIFNQKYYLKSKMNSYFAATLPQIQSRKRPNFTRSGFHAVRKIVLFAIRALFFHQAMNVGFKPGALRVELA